VGLVGDKSFIIVKFLPPIAAGRGRERAVTRPLKKRADRGRDKGFRESLFSFKHLF